MPAHPDDLAGHNCIVVSRPATTFSTWHFLDDGKKILTEVSGNRVANGGSEELASGALVSALDRFLPDRANLYAVTNGSPASHRVRALIDFLVEEFHQE